MKKEKSKKILFNTKLTKDNRLLRDYILRELEKYKSLKKCDALEIGIGNGRFGFLIGKKFKGYYGIEPDKEYLRIANRTKHKKEFVYKLGKAEKIPLDIKFDIVFYSFSWHFIENHEVALKEATRVLNKDGIILIIDPKEDSKGWADKRLIKGSREFDKKRYNMKVRQLRKSVAALKKQKMLKIVEFDSGRINLWILKRKSEN